MKLKRLGFLLILSSPSGAGKTTLARMLRQRCPDLSFSVSVTTRAPRGEERNGIDYHFVSNSQFEAWKAQGAFLEWAEIFGCFYGTLHRDIEQKTLQGSDVLFDIDWQGHASLKRSMPERTVGVFILPPSIQHLRDRLFARGDAPELVEARMRKALDEVAHAQEYDYIITNDRLDEALERLLSILSAERCRRSRLTVPEDPSSAK